MLEKWVMLGIPATISSLTQFKLKRQSDGIQATVSSVLKFRLQ